MTLARISNIGHHSFVIFYRLTADGQSISGKMVVVK